MLKDLAVKRFLPVAMASLAVACCAMIAPGIARAQNVVTYHNTPDRAGAYTVPGLTLAAAANLHQDTAFHPALSGNIYAQPLYWKPAGAKTGLLIVATESNLVYGLNANTGARIWQRQLRAPAPPAAHDCGDIDPEGVTGTPVIDPATGTLYVAAMTIVGDLPRQMVYALSLANGRILPHWPLNVQAAMNARHETLLSRIQGERSALQFVGGKLYVNYGGRAGDCESYHGAVLEIAPSQPPTISNSWLTRAGKGGIWSQAGTASDGKSIFVTTGNASIADTWNDGEAVIRLRPGLAHSTQTKDYFTPSNWMDLDKQDLDLGGTAAVPFTVPASPSGVATRILGLGKDGYAYLLDAANLGGIGHELAKLHVATSRLITAPALYKTGAATLAAFFNASPIATGCTGSSLMVLQITSDAVAPISPLWCGSLKGSGEPIVTTTDGTANPIFWVTGAANDNQLHGFNALTGKVVFSGAGTSMTGLRRFSTLIAANRHLYVAADGTVYAFTF
jgi:outer membrane protein assembly factor BamB